jgi:hypothetical protein
VRVKSVLGIDESTNFGAGPRGKGGMQDGRFPRTRVGTAGGGAASRKRKGEGMRPARVDSMWRRKEAVDERMAKRGEVGEGCLWIRFLFAIGIISALRAVCKVLRL